MTTIPLKLSNKSTGRVNFLLEELYRFYFQKRKGQYTLYLFSFFIVLAGACVAVLVLRMSDEAGLLVCALLASILLIGLPIVYSFGVSKIESSVLEPPEAKYFHWLMCSLERIESSLYAIDSSTTKALVAAGKANEDLRERLMKDYAKRSGFNGDLEIQIVENSGTDYLEPFIESTIVAAARFRRILLVIIITSVLVFGAFWNARPGNWLDSRISLANNAKEYISLKDRWAQIVHELNTLPPEATNRISLEAEQQQLQREISNTDHEIIQWVERKRIHSEEDIKPILDQLYKDHLNFIALRIPFLGIDLDINDLGLLSGFTFVVLLMWFRFSLWREYYNLDLAFDEAKEEHLEYCYKAIAIRQVLTVPPTLSGKQQPIKPWGKVVRILYFLPVLVQLVVFINDCRTFNNGWVLSKPNTIFSISASLCFLVLSIMLTYWCFQLSNIIDKKWDEVAESIRNSFTQ